MRLSSIREELRLHLIHIIYIQVIANVTVVNGLKCSFSCLHVCVIDISRQEHWHPIDNRVAMAARTTKRIAFNR